jgi:hypothetical protein
LFVVDSDGDLLDLLRREVPYKRSYSVERWSYLRSELIQLADALFELFLLLGKVFSQGHTALVDYVQEAEVEDARAGEASLVEEVLLERELISEPLVQRLCSAGLLGFGPTLFEL